MSTPTDSILQRQRQAAAGVQSSPRVRVADGQGKPAERTLGIPAVASMLDRAKAGEGVKTIRQYLPSARNYTPTKGRGSHKSASWGHKMDHGYSQNTRRVLKPLSQ